jgi:glycosyltransferase involved in cell wall biosynthesis
MIRIAIDITDLKYAKTGQKTYLESITNKLKKIKCNDFYFVFFQSPFPTYSNKNFISILVNHGLFQIWKQILLPSKIIINKCDLLFCTDYFVPLFHYRYKSVQVIHDAFFAEYPRHYNKYWLYIYKLFSLPGVYKSSFIITPTEYSKSRILKYFNLETNKIIVISEGPKLFTDNNLKQLKNDYAFIVDKCKYFLHVGVFEKRKNLLFLIKTFNEFIKNNHANYKLIIVGKGTGRKESDDTTNILCLIKELNLHDQIILTGYLNDDELKIIYKNAFAYIFPSYNEGFGLPILEAFYFNIPILVADNSCLPEVGGDAVLTFNPYNQEDLLNKMNLISNDELLRLDLIRKGANRLNYYSWDNTIEDLLNVFKKTINK